MRDTSLVYPIDPAGRVLMGYKLRGMGKGKWNGFGGKLENGETMRGCAVRELWEECGLTADPADLIHCGELYFDQPSDRTWSHGGSVYIVRKWQGNPAASEEMKPRWILPAELPYEEMWQADVKWLPLILKGSLVKGTITFAEDGDTVIFCQLTEVNSIDER